MSTQSIQFDRSLLYDRIQPYKRRPVQSVSRRSPVVQTAAAPTAPMQTILSNSYVAPVEVLPQEAPLQASPASIISTTAERIDFAKRAEAWKLEKQPTKQQKVTVSNRMLMAMATFLFVVGIAVSINSFRIDRVATATVSAQAASGPLDVDEAKPNNLDSYSVAPDAPRIIEIPKLNAKARVMRVGLDKQDTLLAPNNVHDAGWYTGSAKPGEASGATVIDGHISGPTQPGVFVNLKKLQAGDIISIERGDKTKITYKVIKTEQHDVADVNMYEVMQSVTAKHGLNIISCGGAFNRKMNSFEQRIIVYAEQV